MALATTATTIVDNGQRISGATGLVGVVLGGSGSDGDDSRGFGGDCTGRSVDGGNVGIARRVSNRGVGSGYGLAGLGGVQSAVGAYGPGYGCRGERQSLRSLRLRNIRSGDQQQVVDTSRWLQRRHQHQ